MPARAAGDAIWKLRLDYDPSAGLGVPPHVTLMYPFLPQAHLASASIEKLERLRDLDEVAYIRFASVYREFMDLQQVKLEIEQVHSSRRS